MKAYRMVLLFVDHDRVGPESAKRLIEDARLPNRIDPGTVLSLEEADIGEWHDEHPLNYRHKQADEVRRLFGEDV